MSDNWTPGDVAVCIADEGSWAAQGFPIPVGAPIPKKNHFYTVQNVRLKAPTLYLSFQEITFGWHYDSRFFRKIKPLSDEEQDKYREELLNEREAARFIKEGLPAYTRPKENV